MSVVEKEGYKGAWDKAKQREAAEQAGCLFPALALEQHVAAIAAARRARRAAAAAAAAAVTVARGKGSRFGGGGIG